MSAHASSGTCIRGAPDAGLTAQTQTSLNADVTVPGYLSPALPTRSQARFALGKEAT